jgi:hypothetical protein
VTCHTALDASHDESPSNRIVSFREGRADAAETKKTGSR